MFQKLLITNNIFLLGNVMDCDLQPAERAD